MREILFRAKSADNEPGYITKWVEGCYDNVSYGGVPVMQTRLDTFPINPKTLGQFTGLYDKNGVRVFEGDIVRADNGHIGYVVFRNGSFVKRCSCHKLSINTLYGDNETVIGNIYDNPELLEGAKMSV